MRKPTGGTERRGAPAGRGGPLSRWVRVPGAGMRAGRERRSPLLLSGVAARPMRGCCVRGCGDMGGGGEGLLCFELAGAEHGAFAGALGAEFRPLPAWDGLRWSKSLKD